MIVFVFLVIPVDISPRKIQLTKPPNSMLRFMESITKSSS